MTLTLPIKISDRTLEEIDQHGERLQRATGQRRRYTRREIVNNLIAIGLEVSRQRHVPDHWVHPEFLPQIPEGDEA